MIVLGLAGKAGSGKDSVADYLVERYGFIKFSFSDALYREVVAAFDLPDDSLLRGRATKEVPTALLSAQRCKDLAFAATLIDWDDGESATQSHSPRQILQWWGAEYRRAQNPHYWVEQAEDWVQGSISWGPYAELRPYNFVNTSVRFANEREWIRTYEPFGSVWHIHRGNLAPVAAHESETPLPVLPGEREIWNNHTLEYLHKGVDQLLSSSAQFVRMEPPLPMTPPVELDPILNAEKN